MMRKWVGKSGDFSTQKRGKIPAYESPNPLNPPANPSRIPANPRRIPQFVPPNPHHRFYIKETGIGDGDQGIFNTCLMSEMKGAVTA